MKLCEVCGAPEHPEWKAHVFASNIGAASNGASNNDGIRAVEEDSLGGASVMRVDKGGKESCGVGPEVRGVAGRGGSVPKQRWSRDAYNAYQREYMRKRRAR